MNKPTRSLLLAAFVATPLLAAPVGAAEQAEGKEVVEMDSYLCKDVMRMSGENRAVTLGVLHGYVLGTKGTKRFVTEELTQLSTDFMEYCLDHPHEKALASFEKLAK
jgi:hypothetical protein